MNRNENVLHKINSTKTPNAHEESPPSRLSSHNLYYDLHIHSCLSPCGDMDMTPGNIIGMAKVNGLDVIALTDHNSCKNCKAAMHFGEIYDVIVIPGMELTTSEEVHVVCLFATLEDAMKWDAYVEPLILPIKNKPEIFGDQVYCDEYDEIAGSVDTLLISATSISFDVIFDLVKDFGGIAFPAHVNKGSTSLLSNLGFVPPNANFTTFELKNMKDYHGLLDAHPFFKECNVLSNSDAHYLEDIAQAAFTIAIPRFAEEKESELLSENLSAKDINLLRRRILDRLA